MGVFCVDNTKPGLISLEPVVRDVVTMVKKERGRRHSRRPLSFLTTQYENSPFADESMVKPNGRLVRVS
jgi:hypothetical protein